MKIKRSILLAATTVLLGACGQLTETANENTGTEESTPVVIGGNWELSGSAAAYGNAQNNAIKLAVERQNASGSINGRDVTYETYDNKSETAEAATGTTYLIDQKDADIIIGPSLTGGTEAEIPIAQENNVPVISATATGDEITLNDQGDVIDYIFRVCFQDSFQGQAMAEYANQQDFDKVAVIKDNSAVYGQNLAKEFTDQYDGEVAVSESYVSGDTDFNSILTNVKNAGVDAIFIAGYYQEAGPIIRQAREMGIDIAILGPDGFGSDDIIGLAGEENWTNVYYAAHFVYSDDSSEQTKEFYKAYNEKYGEDPDMFAALAYDAANLAFDAIDRAGSTSGEAIQKALAETEDYEGVTGTFSIDENHNPIKTAYIQEVQNGEVVDSTAINPDELTE